jgi:hypothetical protein
VFAHVDGWSAMNHPLFPPAPVPVAPPPPVAVQAKLEVGKDDDPLEEEADRIADDVGRAPMGARPVEPPDPPGTSAGHLLMRKCAAFAQAERTPLRVQRRVSTGAARNVTPAPPSVEQTLGGGGGRPLDEQVRASFESRFGHDFSGVRVHTDARAAASARAIGALAYTVGPHVVFGQGRYAPGATEGRRLLAHELTHVVQQSPGGSVPGEGRIQRDTAPESGGLAQLREKLGRLIVDKEGALKLIDALEPTDKAAVKDDEALRKQMISAFDAKQMLQAAVSLGLPLMLELYMINEAGRIGSIPSGDWIPALVKVSKEEIEQVGGWEKNAFIAETTPLLEAFADAQPTALLVFARDGGKKWADKLKASGIFPRLLDRLAVGGLGLSSDLGSAFWSLYEAEVGAEEVPVATMMKAFESVFHPRIARQGEEFSEGDLKYTVVNPSPTTMKAILGQYRSLPPAQVNLLDQIVFSSGTKPANEGFGTHFKSGRIVIKVESNGDFTNGVENGIKTMTHELGHAVGESKLALAKDEKGAATVSLEDGDAFAARYMVWSEDKQKDWLPHMWNLGDTAPVPLQIGQTQVQVTGEDVKDWILGILEDGAPGKQNPLNKPGFNGLDIGKALSTAAALAGQPLVAYISVLLKNHDGNIGHVHVGPWAVEGYTPADPARVYLYSSHLRRLGYVSIDREAFDNIMKFMNRKYSLGSPSEFFADMYQMWQMHDGNLPPARRNNETLDPATFMRRADAALNKIEGDAPKKISGDPKDSPSPP